MTTSAQAAPPINETSSPQAATTRSALTTLTTRRVVAVVGALCLLMALLTLIPSFMGAISGLWPFFGILIAFGSVVFLRVSTVRERRARIEAAFEAAMNAEREQLRRVAEMQEDPRIVEERARRRREAKVFDAAALESQEAAERQGAEQHEAEQALQAEAAAETIPAESVSAGNSSEQAGTWDPVQVPRPTYLDAPLATRHRPAAAEPAESSTAVPSKIDLDEILRRRRA